MFQNLLNLTREAIVKGILSDHAVTIVDINMVRIGCVGCQASLEGKIMEGNIDSWPRSYFRNINEAIPYIETSDLIVRPKRGGPGDHWGVVLAGGLVLEGQAGLGSCLTGLSDFAPKERVTVIKPPHLYRGIINMRANKELLTGKPYDFLTNNW